MNKELIILKALNNNVVIAKNEVLSEAVLIGKGIGFNRKKGDLISLLKAEKTFVLTHPDEITQYRSLMDTHDAKLTEFLSDLIFYIEARMNKPLNDRIHIALTDHLLFALKRAKANVTFHNPFVYEISSLYPEEYQVAKELIEKINQEVHVLFPEGETGFIALHIHSAVSDRLVRDLHRHHQLITVMVSLIEDNLHVKLDKRDLNYLRLLQHLHRCIDRVGEDYILGKQKHLQTVLKTSYPICYNLAWKLVKVMQKQLTKPVDESEVLYLTIHLQRLTNKM